MAKSESCHPDVWANLACCYFMLGRYEDAKRAAQQGIAHCISIPFLTSGPLINVHGLWSYRRGIIVDKCIIIKVYSSS